MFDHVCDCTERWHEYDAAVHTIFVQAALHQHDVALTDTFSVC